MAPSFLGMSSALHFCRYGPRRSAVWSLASRASPYCRESRTELAIPSWAAIPPAWLTPCWLVASETENLEGRYRGRVSDPPSADRVEPGRWAGDECTRPRARTRTAQVIRHCGPHGYSRPATGHALPATRKSIQLPDGSGGPHLSAETCGACDFRSARGTGQAGG